MNTAEKIIYYTQTKWCIPFRDLYHSVCEICELVKPICPEIEPNKYLDYFLNNIDFDKIDIGSTKEEGLKNCKVIYFGLDQLLRNDIDKGVSEFQMNLSGKRTYDLIQIQNTLIGLCGLLERQTRTSKNGISFAQRFKNFYQSAEEKDRLFPINYQVLIREFNEVIMNDLLSSYKILNDTINKKFPLPIETKIALQKASQKVNEFRKKYNSEIESLKPFLLSKGLILPKDHDEFLFWLLDKKYKQESFFPLPKIEDSDFFEFSNFREKQLENIEILQSEKLNISKNNNSEFDLKKFDLTTNNVSPYFPQPKLIGKEYCIYEGATGNNRFQYFKILKNSKAGKLCKQFIEKYYKKNDHRHEYYDDAQKLIEACKTDPIEKIIGLDAYLKYWNDCNTEADKLMQNIYSIQHFEALKDWYGLAFEKYVQSNEHKYLNDDVRKADIERWKGEVAKEVKEFLQQSAKNSEKKYSDISSVQANELNKFYEWIIESQAKQNQQLNTESKEDKPTIAAYAIMHVYLALFGGKAVTQQNKDTLAKSYGCKNGDQLRNEFTKYQNDTKRLDLNTTNKKSADAHLKRFKTILPLLEAENNKAFEKAKEDLRWLENLYSKHY